MEASVDQTQLYILSLNHFLAPLKSLFDDPEITEVLINGRGSDGDQAVYYERDAQLHRGTCPVP